MQGRGNFAPNYGQVPSTSMPYLYQQLPPPPPPPPFQFQQGVSGSRPHLIQQGPGSFGCQPRGHGYGQGLPGAPMGYGGVLNLPRPPPLDLPRPPLQQSGGVSGFQHILPPPPPPPLSSSTMLGGAVQSASMVSLPPPPPLPSLAPPMPPSPPLSNFPAPPGGSMSSDDLSKDPETSKACNSEMYASSSIQKLPDQNMVTNSTLFNGNGSDGKDVSAGKVGNLGRKEGENLVSQPSSSKQSEENQGQSDIQSAPVSIESTLHPNHLVLGSGSHSLADSDMEMEDDITQPDGDLRFNDLSNGLYHTSDAVRSEHDMKGHLHAQQNSVEYKKQDDGPSDDLKNPIAQGMKIGKNSSELVKDGSPFRLLQEYASDDTLENDEHNAPKDIPEEASPSVTMDNLDCIRHNEKLLSESSQLLKAQETSADPKEDVKKITTASVAPKATYEDVHNKYKNPLGGLDTSYDSFRQKDAKLAGADFAVSVNENLQKDIKKSAPPSPKVDEFGRLVREGASDSEPDDKSYTRRHGKRVRSRSRSSSSVDRRRRRSPRRRRERRSRSHSRSPRHPRSRSRSPTFRRADDFRRDKGRKDCFDFLKGRCYRGTSCRFMHHDPDKSERSRHHRGNQQHMEVPSRSKSSGRHENISSIYKKVSRQEHDIAKSQEKRQSQDAKDDNYPLQVSLHAKICKQGSHWIESEILESESPKRIAAEVNETQFFKAEPQTASNLISNTGDCKDSVGTVDHGDKKLLQHMDNFSMPCTSSDQKSLPNKEVSSEHAPNLMLHGQPAHGIVAPPVPKERPFSLPPHSAPMGSYPYMLPGQHSYVALPPTSSWTPLPLPPPPPTPYGPSMDARVVTSTVCSQIQSSNVPSRDSIGLQTCPRPYVAELPVNYPNSGYEQRPGIPIRVPNQSLLYGDDFKLRPPTLSNAGSQECGGNHLRSDLSGELTVQGLTTSNSAPESISNNMQFLPEQSKPLGEHINTSIVAHPHLQQQPRPYTSQYSAIDSVLSIPGSNDPSLSRYQPDLPTRSQPSYPLPDFGGFKTSAHYNPYASTFEQPLNSRFGMMFFPHESLSRAKPDGGDVGSSGSRQATSSPNAGKLPRSGGDQYDPLFDSIEPSDNSVKKIDHAKKLQGANDSVRLSGSNKPLDVEENNKRKEVGAVATTASDDNEEFGETADAEVDMVENESLSSPVDAADMAAGEAEIDQVKSSTKSRKSKDSRSMKVFKVALANFVKDILKPSWRQGNMSKEAFKTIVKKTVDKVSGAMKSHHIPKSQAKIDQYINSSQRKLTKLVMGYVDKYVKA